MDSRTVQNEMRYPKRPLFPSNFYSDFQYTGTAEDQSWKQKRPHYNRRHRLGWEELKKKKNYKGKQRIGKVHNKNDGKEGGSS